MVCCFHSEHSSYNSINVTRFRGTSRTWTLDQYIDLHAAVYAELLECNEPVLETNKATDFLAGISCPKLEMAEAHILGMDTLNDNFEPFQNYINTYHLNVRESEKRGEVHLHCRSCKSTRSEGINQPDQKKKQQNNHFSNKEWKALSTAERDMNRKSRGQGL